MKKRKPALYETKELSRIRSPLNEEELVETYLDMNYYWWMDSENSLYGKREDAKEMLLYWLRNGDEPGRIRHEMIYVMNNFQTDFMKHFQRVA